MSLGMCSCKGSVALKEIRTINLCGDKIEKYIYHCLNCGIIHPDLTDPKKKGLK